MIIVGSTSVELSTSDHMNDAIKALNGSRGLILRDEGGGRYTVQVARAVAADDKDAWGGWVCNSLQFDSAGNILEEVYSRKV